MRADGDCDVGFNTVHDRYPPGLRQRPEVDGRFLVMYLNVVYYIDHRTDVLRGEARVSFQEVNKRILCIVSYRPYTLNTEYSMACLVDQSQITWAHDSGKLVIGASSSCSFATNIRQTTSWSIISRRLVSRIFNLSV
jgi:hypothetical protein